MKEVDDNYSENFPKDHIQARKILVDEFINNLDKYKPQLSKQERKHLKVFYNLGQIPCPEILLVAAELFDIDIYVHHGIQCPVIYKNSTHPSPNIIHLQCISMIHYNPLVQRKIYQKKHLPANDKYINYIIQANNEIGKDLDVSNDNDEEDLDEELNDKTHLI